MLEDSLYICLTGINTQYVTRNGSMARDLLARVLILETVYPATALNMWGSRVAALITRHDQ